MLIKLLKNSLKIYKVDLSKICRNWVSLVVLGGLILLPSLYAWVNIYASWDPYGNTKGIKISVVNEDKGSSIKESEVNIGTEVVSSLKENESLGWTFFENREEALAELNKGNVYATIIIPEDFSKKILTLIDKEPVKPQLEYYVNEKINAIAPKITDKGAATIQSQITSSFIETVADKVIEVMHSVGVEVDKQYPTIEKLENMIIGLQDKFPTLEVGLEYLTEKARDGKVFVDRQDQNIIQLQKIISQLIGFNDDITQALDELSTKPEEVIPEIKEDLILIQTIFADIARSTTELKEAIELNKPVLINDIDQGIAKLEGIKERLTGITNKLGELDQDISSTVSDVEHELISTLNDYINALEELKLNLDTPEGALKVLSKIEHIHYKLADQIQSLRKTIEGVAEGIDGQLAKLQYILEKIEAIKPLHDLEKAPLESDILSSDEELRVLEENNNTELDTNFRSEIEDILALVGEAKENMSHNKELFSDALYLLEDMEDSLTALKDGFNNSSLVEEKLGQLKVQGRGLSSVVGTIRARIDVKVNGILDKLSTVEQIMREVASGANGLKNIIMSVTSGGREKVEEIVDNIEKVQDKLEDVAHKVIKASHSKVDKVETKVEDIKVNLAELEKRLGKLNSVLEDRGVLEETLQNIAQLNFNIQASLDQTIDLLDADFITKIKEELSKVSVFTGDISGLLSDVKNELNYLREFGVRLGEKSELLVEDINEVKAHVPQIEEDIDKVVDKINFINENVDIKELINELTMDNSEKSNFLAAPVILNTHKLYPMANYGASMTPFYTTLCLWVGALLLCALLTTKAKNADFEYTPVEEYLGKYLLFATLAALQGFIASVGDIVVLGVEVKEPVLFIGLAVCYSIIFTAIVYTLVSLLGNVGKAIGVVLLVLQLAGSGGTFPIQVTPDFFQKIHELLPFTYGISAMREAIAGVYYETLAKDLVVLGLFFIFFIFIGVLLKKKANAFLHRFSKKLGESGVIEH